MRNVECAADLKIIRRDGRRRSPWWAYTGRPPRAAGTLCIERRRIFLPQVWDRQRTSVSVLRGAVSTWYRRRDSTFYISRSKPERGAGYALTERMRWPDWREQLQEQYS